MCLLTDLRESSPQQIPLCALLHREARGQAQLPALELLGIQWRGCGAWTSRGCNHLSALMISCDVCLGTQMDRVQVIWNYKKLLPKVSKRQKKLNAQNATCLQFGQTFSCCCCLCVLRVFHSPSLMHEAGCLIETWQLHTAVCVCVLTAPDCCETHRERTVYSLFSLKHRQHPSPVTEGGAGKEWGVTGKGVILMLKGFSVFKAWIHIRLH